VSRRRRFEASTLLLLSPWIVSLLLFGSTRSASRSRSRSTTTRRSTRRQRSSSASRTTPRRSRTRCSGPPLKNTLTFVFGTIPFTTLLALGLALALQKRFRGRDFFRAGFFLPTVVSIVVISLVWKGLYAPDGFLSSLVRALGGTPPRWLLEPHTALASIMAMDVWAASGYYMVIFLAGLQAIPEELYESASLEGATPWQKFVHITLPMLKPTFLFVLVVNSVRSLQVFTEVFVMTGGGPLHATLTSVFYLYEQAFYKFRLGYASSIAYLLFALTLGLAFLQVRWLKLESPRT
jgi:multiple sugar transport system permease protein